MMRLLVILLCLNITGCYVASYNVDDLESHLHTEASHCSVSYGWNEDSLCINFTDPTQDLRHLLLLRGTAFIWTDSESYPLIGGGITYDGDADYNPNGGTVKSIRFCFKVNNPKAKEIFPLNGIYNISAQFNGAAGIHTLCGSFKIVKSSHLYNDGLR